MKLAVLDSAELGRTSKYDNWLKTVDYIFDKTKLDKFLQCTCDYRIAVIDVDHTWPNKTYEFVQQIIKNVDKVIITIVEFFEHIHLELVQKLDYNKVIFVINGKPNPPLQQAKVLNYWAYFTHISYYYRFTNIRQDSQWESKLGNLTDVKPYRFDFLPGTPTPAKKLALKWIKNAKPGDYLVSKLWKEFSFRGERPKSFINTEDKIFWEPEQKIFPKKGLLCEYFGQEMKTCSVLPLQLWQQTQYSLICETEESDLKFYPTERVPNAILGQRLFIVIGPYHFLHNLKSIGFKTFDSIIDENYDNEKDDTTRWNMALEQSQWLCRQDPSYVLKQILPIVKHNQKVLFDINFDVLTDACEQVVKELT